MLKRGNSGIRLRQIASAKAAYHSTAHTAGQQRVFTECLLDTAPARISRQVEYRTIADVAALTTHLAPYYLAYRMHQFRIPCSSHSKASRKYGSTDGHMTVRSLFGKEYRNTESCIFDYIFLDCISGTGCLFGGEAVVESLAGPGVGAISGPEHSGSCLLNKIFELLRHLHRFRAGNLIHLPTQRTQKLAYFFLDCHS